MSNNDKHLIRFASGTGRNLGKARNETASWLKFTQMLSRPLVTSEKQKDYNKLPEDDQKSLKAAAGWIYRTGVNGPMRNRGSGLPSDLISFDFDYATPEFFEAIQAGVYGSEFEFFIHTSRRHTAEKPRFRMFIPVATPIPTDVYQVVSRIAALQFDPEMKHVDKVSFRPAQMMFRPTISKDQDFVSYRNQGRLLDWSELLDIFEVTVGDWHDLSNLPVTPGEKLRVVKDKAEDPTTKAGPVGDFCRAYDVPAAIEAFLSDKYELVDETTGKPRYTYLGGTTTNGAEVQDGGLFLYSHHGSDPCSDMLVNAFDLVRIHLFHDKDDKEADDLPMAKKPSFKHMMEFIKEDPRYREQVVKSRYDLGAMASDFTDDMVAGGSEAEDEGDDDEIALLIGGPAKSKKTKIDRDGTGAPISVASAVPRKKLPPPPDDWIQQLGITLQGQIVSNLPNITQILINDLRLRHSIEYNDFHAGAVSRSPIKTRVAFIPNYSIGDQVNGEPIQDHHLFAVRGMLEYQNGPGKPGYGLKNVTDRDLNAAVETAARLNSFHPVRDMLENLKHDGRKRVETFFMDYFGCPDNAYHRQTALCFFVAAVARVFEPGHKFDFVPILFGAQGKRKSTAIKILAKSWFGELNGDFGDGKKMVEKMVGHWIMELPELSSITRSQIEDVKAFITATKSNERMAYGRRAQQFLRQCVFIGSTNDEEYLIDRTGNRRWWPINVKVGLIDTDKLARNVDMIWAEAVKLYRAMRAEQPHGTLPLFLTDPEAIAEANKLTEAARIQTDADSYAAIIGDWLDKKIEPEGWDDFDQAMRGNRPEHRRYVCIAQVWTEALEQSNRITTTDSRAVGNALRAAGWLCADKPRRFPGYGLSKVFYPGPKVVERWAFDDGPEGEFGHLI